jgi:hypothetical protein
VIDQSGSVMQLKTLNLQNNRMGDKVGISLLNSVFTRTAVSNLNVAQNGLGFKTGQFILNHVVACCSPTNMGKLALSKINLGFNVMSESLIDRVTQALTQLNQLKKHPVSLQTPAKPVRGKSAEKFAEFLKSRNSVESTEQLSTSGVNQNYSSFIGQTEAMNILETP